MTRCAVPRCGRAAHHVFPKDINLKTLWLKAIRRPNFAPTKYSRICREHFIDSDYGHVSIYTGVVHQRKCLKKTAVPSVFSWNEIKPTKHAKDRSKRLKTRNAPKILFQDQPSVFSQSEDILPISKEEADISHKVQIKSEVEEHISHEVQIKSEVEEDISHEVQIKSEEEEDISYEVPIKSEAEDIFHKVQIKSEVEEDISYEVQINTMSTKLDRSAEAVLSTVATQTPNILRLFSTEMLLADDQMVNYYTGLESVSKFNFVLSTLLSMAHNIKYCWSKVLGLSMEDQFLMMLIKLRLNRPDFELSKMFGVSKTEVSNIVVIWINFVNNLWKVIDNWPSRELQDFIGQIVSESSIS